MQLLSSYYEEFADISALESDIKEPHQKQESSK